MRVQVSGQVSSQLSGYVSGSGFEGLLRGGDGAALAGQNEAFGQMPDT